MRVLVLILMLYPLLAVPQIATQKPEKDLGQLSIDYTNVDWPSPEELVRDLQSTDDGLRIKALHLLGATDQLIHVPVWSQASQTHITGTKVVVPDQVALHMARISDGETLVPLIAAELPEGQTMLGAIAIRKNNHWERIAAFSCWCRYETGDALTSFVQFVPSPLFSDSDQNYELVVRASGGGTGIYTQDEAHFRIRANKLHLLIHFVARERNCNSTGPSRGCELNRRWLVTTTVDGKPGAILVHASGRLPETASEIDFRRDVESRFLSDVSCTAYLWNEEELRYEEVAEKPHPCALR